jgi:hypothetical protein
LRNDVAMKLEMNDAVRILQKRYLGEYAATEGDYLKTVTGVRCEFEPRELERGACVLRRRCRGGRSWYHKGSQRAQAAHNRHESSSHGLLPLRDHEAIGKLGREVAHEVALLAPPFRGAGAPRPYRR